MNGKFIFFIWQNNKIPLFIAFTTDVNVPLAQMHINIAHQCTVCMLLAGMCAFQ